MKCRIPLSCLVLIIACTEAMAAIRIPVSRDMAWTIVVIWNCALALVIGWAFWKRSYGTAFFLVALMAFPLVVTAIVHLSGVPIRW